MVFCPWRDTVFFFHEYRVEDKNRTDAIGGRIHKFNGIIRNQI